MVTETNDNLLDTTNAAKYLEISERSFRWYRNEYNKENTNDPLNPIKEGIKHLYSESDLEKLRNFLKSRKKSKSNIDKSVNKIKINNCIWYSDTWNSNENLNVVDTYIDVCESEYKNKISVGLHGIKNQDIIN